MENIRHVFVERRLADGRHLDELIAAELRQMGYDAGSGPLTLAPRGTDAIVTYEDQWTFDFTTYMISLTIRVRDERSAKPLADASIYRPSVTGDSPSAVVRQTLVKLFKPITQPVTPQIEGGSSN